MSPLAWFAVAAFAALVFWGTQIAKRQRSSLISFAAEQGWQYDAVDRYRLRERWQHWPFSAGGVVTDVVTATWAGWPLLAFNYSYPIQHADGEGSRTEEHPFAVCVLGLPAYLPDLHVCRETALDRSRQLATDEIDLESEDFHRAFRVRSDNGKFASDVLHPQTMEFLLAHGRGVEWRIDGSDILTWCPGRLNGPDLVRRTTVLSGVVDAIPSFVWKDNDSDSAAPDG